MSESSQPHSSSSSPSSAAAADSYRSIREQLISLSVDAEDKAQVGEALKRRVNAERAAFGRVEDAIAEEYQRLIEHEIHEHSGAQTPPPPPDCSSSWTP